MQHRTVDANGARLHLASLGDTFDLDLAMSEGVGHFPHRENPDRTAHEIASFFTART